MNRYFLVISLLWLMMASSCMTHRHTIGEGPVGTKGKTQIHSRAKQGFIFWGLVPLGRPEPHKPSHGNYQIKTGSNVGDAILGILTAGIVQFRTIRIIVHKEEKIFDKEYERGGKLAFKKGKESIIGEVIELDKEKAKVEIQYLDVYGETKTTSKGLDEVSALSEEQYNERLAEWQKIIDSYKYDIGEFASWKQGKENRFGEITHLNNKNHKASVEFLDIYGDKKQKDIPYLDVVILDADTYNKQLAALQQEIAQYKFSVGEKVSWKTAKNELQEGEVVLLNNKSHQADVKYIDDKGEEKVMKKGYLKLIKKA